MEDTRNKKNKQDLENLENNMTSGGIDNVEAPTASACSSPTL
jgi:hypothetical protein